MSGIQMARQKQLALEQCQWADVVWKESRAAHVAGDYTESNRLLDILQTWLFQGGDWGLT